MAKKKKNNSAAARKRAQQQAAAKKAAQQAAKAKQRQKETKALQNARKDGKVTASEAKKLKNLGVKPSRIANTKKAKVTPAAVKQVQPKPKSNTRPKPVVSSVSQTKNTVSSAVKDLQIAGSGADKGGNKFLTGKQANQVLKLVNNIERFPPTTTEDPEGNITTTPGDVNYESLNGQRLIEKALRGLKKDNNPINSISSQNDINKIKNYVQGIATTREERETLAGGERGSGNYNDIKDAYYGDIRILTDRAEQYADMRNNIVPYSPEFKALADKLGQTPTLEQFIAAKKDRPDANLGKDFDKFNDQISSVGKNKNQGNNDPSYREVERSRGNNNKNKGTYGGNAYNPFEAAAIASGKSIGPTVNGIGKIKNLGINTGGYNPFKEAATAPGESIGPTINGIGEAQDETYNPFKEAATAPGESIGPTVEGIGKIEDLGPNTAPFNDNPYEDLISALEGQISSLNLDIENMINNNTNTNTYLTEQAAAASAAYKAAETRATNLANAFVPNANPNANSINYGDYRKRSRRKENNQLSDLSILSDVGDASNPLAGLQLA